MSIISTITDLDVVAPFLRSIGLPPVPPENSYLFNSRDYSRLDLEG